MKLVQISEDRILDVDKVFFINILTGEAIIGNKTNELEKIEIGEYDIQTIIECLEASNSLERIS